MDDGVEEVELGLYLVKGDMMSVCSFHSTLVNPLTLTLSVLIGEIDEAIDQAVDLGSIRAEPIPPIRY
jgi:U6 snRNA-associated Sm-like protein LSm8